MTQGLVPVEAQRRVGLREVEVRSYLGGAGRGGGRDQRQGRPPRVQRHGALARQDLARDHGIGSCTVTSLVPSGNVASTWTSVSISGTPSITSSLVSTARPVVISSTTGRPSRAPSSRNDVIRAAASG